jgi:hypothetical protein
LFDFILKTATLARCWVSIGLGCWTRIHSFLEKLIRVRQVAGRHISFEGHRLFGEFDLSISQGKQPSGLAKGGAYFLDELSVRFRREKMKISHGSL